LLAFEVDGATYALDIGLVREVVVPQAVAPIPHARPEVAGLGEHRGEIVPVVDVRAWLRRPPGAPTRRARWIVVRAVGRSAALAVDAVLAPIGLEEAPSPPPEVGPGADARAIAGVTTYAGRPLLILDGLALVRGALGTASYGPAGSSGA
jgi:purine-binding chemotaxis protein CheW